MSAIDLVVLMGCLRGVVVRSWLERASGTEAHFGTAVRVDRIGLSELGSIEVAGSIVPSAREEFR